MIWPKYSFYLFNYLLQIIRVKKWKKQSPLLNFFKVLKIVFIFLYVKKNQILQWFGLVFLPKNNKY